MSTLTTASGMELTFATPSNHDGDLSGYQMADFFTADVRELATIEEAIEAYMGNDKDGVGITARHNVDGVLRVAPLGAPVLLSHDIDELKQIGHEWGEQEASLQLEAVENGQARPKHWATGTYCGDLAKYGDNEEFAESIIEEAARVAYQKAIDAQED